MAALGAVRALAELRRCGREDLAHLGRRHPGLVVVEQRAVLELAADERATILSVWNDTAHELAPEVAGLTLPELLKEGIGPSTIRTLAALGFLELTEHNTPRGGQESVVNSMSVYEYDAAGKLVHLDIYLQHD